MAKQTKQYNINELLELKKELDKQIEEKIHQINTVELIYVEEEMLDHTNKKNNRKNIPRDRVTLNEYTNELNGLIEQLAKVKIAIQKHNADKVVELIQKRESARKRIQLLTKIKQMLPKDRKKQRRVLRQDKDDVALESVDILNEPMFDIKDVEKQYNEAAAQERKLNTEIQRLNLNAKITL